MRKAAFTNQTQGDTLTERTIPRSDRERPERYVCELSRDRGRCGLIFTSWKKFVAHQTHKGGNHGITSPRRVSVNTNQCANRGSTFADRPTAQNHVVNSRIKGTCRTDHMTWSLEEVTQPISSCPCAQEFLMIRTNRHAQLVRQPRRHWQHSRYGHELEPKDYQDGCCGRTRAAKPKTPPKYRRPHQDGGASGSAMALAAKPKEDSKGEQKSRNQIMLKAKLKTHQTLRDLSSMV